MSQDLGRTQRDVRVTGVAEEGIDRTHQDIRIDSRRKIGWWQNAWLLPIAVVLVIVILQSAPPFLTFDPATESIAPLNPRVPALNYFLLVTHVLTGTIAIVTVCLAVWPWLRIRHMAVHRWIGRAYVFSALPASLCTLAINYLRSGWFANVGAYVEGGVWFLTTLIGYIAMRQRNEARHRRWMLYSFAMCAAVFWGWFLDMVITPNQTNLPYLMELIRWVGWLTNLLVVKWWLDRTERRVDRYATR